MKKVFDRFTQIALPTFTIGGILLVSLKFPGWGLFVNLLAQPFWVYSSWKAYKKAHQSGMFITTIIMTCVLIFGVINYFFIK